MKCCSIKSYKQFTSRGVQSGWIGHTLVWLGMDWSSVTSEFFFFFQSNLTIPERSFLCDLFPKPNNNFLAEQ